MSPIPVILLQFSMRDDYRLRGIPVIRLPMFLAVAVQVAGPDDFWAVNISEDGRVGVAAFFPTSRFRHRFYRPDVIARVLE